MKMWHGRKRENYTTLNNKEKCRNWLSLECITVNREIQSWKVRKNTGSCEKKPRRYVQICQQKFLWLQYNIIKKEQEKPTIGMED